MSNKFIPTWESRVEFEALSENSSSVQSEANSIMFENIGDTDIVINGTRPLNVGDPSFEVSCPNLNCIDKSVYQITFAKGAAKGLNPLIIVTRQYVTLPDSKE